MQKHTIIKNLSWKFAERIGNRGINFIISLILARILSPEEFGTIALVTVFISILQVFIYAGFGNSLVQKKDADNLDFSTIFIFQVISCTVVYTLLFFSAPFIANFYNDLTLTAIIRVLGIKLLIAGLLSVQNARLSRKMQFKKLFVSNLIGVLLSAVVGISMAYMGFGVWALVGQTLTATCVGMLVLWFTVDFRPQFKFSVERFKSLFSFGWKLLISNLIEEIYKNLRNLIIGRFYSATDLGHYNRGEQFPKFVISNTDATVNAVLLPAMSKAQDSKEQIKAMTRRAVSTSSYIVWPCMIGLFVCAEPLVELVLTAKWLPCVPYIRIFCITYAFWPIQTANISAIKAIGRSDVFLKLQVIKKIIGITAIVISLNFGIFAVALSSAIVAPIDAFINASPNKKLINYGYWEQVKDMVPSILLSCVMGVAVWYIQYLNFHNVFILLLQILAGIISYILLSYVFKLRPFFYILDTLKDITKKFNKK